MRLDRFVCTATGQSRSQVQQLIRRGAVSVEGKLLRTGSYQLPEQARVFLEGAELFLPQAQYLMLHKPQGYVCATTDGDHPVVIDLIDEVTAHRGGREPLQVVGRLDKDTTGLLLLTTDGQWNHRVTAPSADCVKVYQVELADRIGPDAVDQLQQGVQLRSEKQPTKPCTIELVGEKTLTIAIREGRYHQVKRMFAAVGNKVLTLHRAQVGSVQLEPELLPGQHRPLTHAEIHSFQ